MSLYIVDKEDVAQFAAILLTLVQNQKLRDSMGMAGRQTVKEKYDWQDSLSIMEIVYRQMVSVSRGFSQYKPSPLFR
jgi:glycosyltransferase involved in cell wall biosynthesis